MQRKNNNFYGYVLPTILRLKVKFENLRDYQTFSKMKATLENLLQCLHKRFIKIFTLNQNSYETTIHAATFFKH